MCEQCVAKATLYVGPAEERPLPGYSLVRATQDGWSMKKDDWGLVDINDPAYWWSVTPVEDPLAGLTDEQINAMEDGPKDAAFDAAVESLSEGLAGRSVGMLGPDVMAYPRIDCAIRLYEAAKSVGYDQERDGSFAHWLCHRLAVFLKTAKPHVDSTSEAETRVS
jgi:hypothetical protein